MTFNGINPRNLFLSPKIHVIAIILLSVLVLFHNLGNESLRPLDEAKWGQISREMVRTGDWLTPRIEGKIFQHKPPLRMWLNSAAFILFGENEFSLRFWSVLSGTGIILLTYLFSYLLFQNSLLSLASSLVLLLSPVFVFEYLRIGDEHATFTLLLMLCLYLFWLGRQKKKFFYISSVFLGLAFLDYGFGALFAPAIILIYLAVTKEIKEYGLKMWLAYLLIFLAVALPWHIYQYNANQVNFFKIYLGEISYYFNADIIRTNSGWVNFLGRDFSNRMAGAIDASFFRGPDFYLNVLRFAFFPWWVVLAVSLATSASMAVLSLLRRKKVPASREEVFIGIWIMVILSVLFLFGDKMSWRIYCLFPVLAILTARSLAWFFKKGWGGFAALAAIASLVVLYQFRILLPVCLGPSCIGHIELYGFPKSAGQLLLNDFVPRYSVTAILFVFISSGFYFFAKDKKIRLFRLISGIILVLYLSFIGINNFCSFFYHNKTRSDIDLVVREIRGLPQVTDLVVYDPVLYAMKKGLIAPEYSLGGAAAGRAGKHRWDSYYYITGLGINEEFVEKSADFMKLFKTKRTNTAFLVNRDSWEKIKKEGPGLLPRSFLERGDYVLIL